VFPNTNVKKSIIPGAGNGLFAEQHIKPGTVIGLYHGNVVVEDDQESDDTTVKLFEIAASKSIAREHSLY
jgi:hypothetical protein